ncbi:MAG TPA: DUF4062 domain-containing protein [bacterium]|nr:DUF4062 domain-containing protein [bacterium]
MAKKKTIMVSSTVYGIEELLEKIYSLLTSFGYEVWMSHKGTIPVLSKKTAFENCLDAVEKCDLFLGIITPFYGSGTDEKDAISITHMELRKAVELNKLRWLLSHDHVVFARNFLKNLGYDTSEKRKALKYKKSDVFGDLRVIDMYEEAILSQQPLRDRKGNWVQKFDRDEDAQLFTTAQFSRFQEAEEFINDNIKKKGGSK